VVDGGVVDGSGETKVAKMIKNMTFTLMQETG
jgi:hypothetical protein